MPVNTELALCPEGRLKSSPTIRLMHVKRIRSRLYGRFGLEHAKGNDGNTDVCPESTLTEVAWTLQQQASLETPICSCIRPAGMCFQVQVEKNADR